MAKLSLRYYQEEAIQALFDYWASGATGNPLIELATGTGKSLVIAALLERLVARYPNMRFMMLTHVKELVEQNYKELMSLWPDAPCGIYSAGLNRRDSHQRIVFGTVQSVAKKADIFAPRDLIIIDEAHLVPNDGDGQYLSFLAALLKSSPHLRVVGLTATPYRLDSGRLDEGENRLFDRVVYSYGLGPAVNDGFLSPLVAKHGASSMDTRSLAVRGGEFTGAAMDEAAMPLVEATADDICDKGRDRSSWIVFCTGVEHSIAMRDALRARGISAETVTGKTEDGERDRLVEGFKAGKFRALTGVNVLLTGFNAPRVDLVAMVRPTQSRGLLVQALGRGTRLFPGKANCLVLDYGENIERFGPVDLIGQKRKDDDSEGGIRVKMCPDCDGYYPPARYKSECGYIWPECGLECIECNHKNDPKLKQCASCGSDLRASPQTVCLACMASNPPDNLECWQCFAPLPERKREANHDTVAAEVAVMAADVKAEWVDVRTWGASEHIKRGASEGTPTTLRVEYECTWGFVSEWLCFSHPLGTFPRRKADQWWVARGGALPVPKSTQEALDRFGEMVPPSAISTVREGNFERIVDYGQPQELWEPDDNSRGADAVMAWGDDYDDIPF